MSEQTERTDARSDSSPGMHRSASFDRFAIRERPTTDDVAQSEVLVRRGDTIRETVAGDVGRTESLFQLIQGALRCVLHPSSSDAEIRAAMRHVGVVGRKEGLQPEWLLVAFKKAWRASPETRRMTPDDGEATLSYLITLCIEEYYAPLRPLRAQP